MWDTLYIIYQNVKNIYFYLHFYLPVQIIYQISTLSTLSTFVRHPVERLEPKPGPFGRVQSRFITQMTKFNSNRTL